VRVEVVYANSTEQLVLQVEAPTGATVDAVIRISSILQRFSEIDLAHVPVGIFGERVALETVVQDGDRVEIYRPLLADPKEARRRRARKRR
jgi:uncharacterized protein